MLQNSILCLQMDVDDEGKQDRAAMLREKVLREKAVQNRLSKD